MSNNVTSIEDRVRQGRIERSRERVAGWTRSTVTELRHVGPFMEARAEQKSERDVIKRNIHLEMLKAYSMFSPEEAQRIVSEAHKEVRKSKGVTA